MCRGTFLLCRVQMQSNLLSWNLSYLATLMCSFVNDVHNIVTHVDLLGHNILTQVNVLCHCDTSQCVVSLTQVDLWCHVHCVHLTVEHSTVTNEQCRRE